MPLELCRIQRTWLRLAALFLRPIWDPVSAPAALRRRQAWTWDQVFLQLYGQLLALSDSWATPGFLLKEHVGQGRIMTIKKKGPIKMLSTEIVSICCLTGCPFLLIICRFVMCYRLCARRKAWRFLHSWLIDLQRSPAGISEKPSSCAKPAECSSEWKRQWAQNTFWEIRTLPFSLSYSSFVV